jgi:ribonuclease P protein component
VLGRAHRVTRADDFRTAVRRGRRAAQPHAVLYRLRSPSADPPRFGVIVSKQVGSAVVRNRVRRRVQAVCATAVSSIPVPAGDTIVIRALPGAGEVDWDTLRAEIDAGLRRVVTA